MENKKAVQFEQLERDNSRLRSKIIDLEMELKIANWFVIGLGATVGILTYLLWH